MLCGNFELVDSFLGGIFKIFLLYFYFISNLLVTLLRMIRMKIYTATSKSTRFVKMLPSTTHHNQDLPIWNLLKKNLVAEFIFTTSKIISDLTVVFFAVFKLPYQNLS